MSEKPTESEAGLIRHALGLYPTGGILFDPWRNHFCATPGTDDDLAWKAMTARGWARLVGRPHDLLPYNTYRVTGAGAAAVGAELPKRE